MYKQDPKYKPCYTGISVVRLYNSQVSLNMGIEMRFTLSIRYTFVTVICVEQRVFSLLLTVLDFTVVTGEVILKDCDRTSKPLTEFHQIAMVIHRLSAHVKLVIKGYSF